MLNIKPRTLGCQNEVIDTRFDVKENDGKISISFSLSNKAKVKEIILIDEEHNLPPDTKFYGDGYQKLSQYIGTISQPKSIGYYDKDHYKMPTTDGFFTVYNFAYFYKSTEKISLIGALTCKKFRLEIRFNNKNIQVVQCLENIEIEANQNILLEDIILLNGEKNQTLENFANFITQNNSIKKFKEFPVGWCSWYCVGPDITEDDIYNNLKEIKEKTPNLKYIQIDDGFQPFMGDWLEVGEKFSKPMKEICQEIKNQGFEPAIWVAPFIASPKSALLKNHPDYFVKDDKGEPLSAEKVTFRGWRDAPWYFLDTTNPDAQKFLFDTFKTMYKEWGVKYYKLDANAWGCLPFGNRYNKNMTCIESYHLGMQEIWKAVENDAFILGCNAPMWASIGEVSGMRITNDTSRNSKTISSLSDECFYRNWMHDKLWINDPDCMLLANSKANVVDPSGNLSKKSFKSKLYKLNNVYIRASGGIILSGDHISKYGQKQVDLIKRIVNSTHKSAKFDETLQFGVIENENDTEYVIFCKKFYKKFVIDVKPNCIAIDMYNDKELKIKNNKLVFRLKKYDCEWIKIIQK